MLVVILNDLHGAPRSLADGGASFCCDRRLSSAITGPLRLSLHLWNGGMRIISREYSNELVRRVEEMSFDGNYFALNPTVWRLFLPQRLWEGLAGIGRGDLD